jgi:hypothetical protein
VTRGRQHVDDSLEAPRADEDVAVVAPPTSGRFKTTLIIVAFVYLLTVWLDGVGSNLPAKTTPRVWLYFAQIAALFKNAGMMAIDYRAEGWSCSERRWIEVDVRPWFRIDADTKESRFHRAMQFYRKERKVMQALEDYVLHSHNASGSRPTIGGVRFLSLRIPYPKLGDHVERVEHKPLSEYPNEMRHPWYVTPASRRRERCGDRAVPPKDGGGPASRPEEDDRATPSSTDEKDTRKDPEP